MCELSGARVIGSYLSLFLLHSVHAEEALLEYI